MSTQLGLSGLNERDEILLKRRDDMCGTDERPGRDVNTVSGVEKFVLQDRAIITHSHMIIQVSLV